MWKEIEKDIPILTILKGLHQIRTFRLPLEEKKKVLNYKANPPNV